MTTTQPTMYSPGPGCRACMVTRLAFEQEGVPLEIRAASSPEGQAALDRALALGHPRQAPIVEWGDRLWTGFRPDEIARVATENAGAAA